MRKLITAMNMTLDGYCDHTSMIADDELHDHYTDLLSKADTILYGRKTYELMEYWRPIANNPTGNKAEDEFAVVMDKISKIVFSHTLKSLDWPSATLAKGKIKQVVAELQQQTGKDILVGSPGLIATCTELDLVDEHQLCIHPVIAGHGLPLFKNINDGKLLKLLKTKIFSSGAIVHYFEPIRK